MIEQLVCRKLQQPIIFSLLDILTNEIYDSDTLTYTNDDISLIVSNNLGITDAIDMSGASCVRVDGGEFRRSLYRIGWEACAGYRG